LEILLDEELFPTENLKLPSSSFIVHDFLLVVYDKELVKLWAIFGLPDLNEDENYIGIFRGPQFDLEFSYKIPSYSGDVKAAGICPTFRFQKPTSIFEEPFAFMEVANYNASHNVEIAR